MKHQQWSAAIWIGAFVLTLGGVVADAAEGGKTSWQTLSLLSAKSWEFVEGPWKQDAHGVITAPDNVGDANLAIQTGRAYKDFEAEFKFRADTVWTDPGFVFRAADPTHYYVVHFPYVGQQYRAEHFWAAISKVGDSGYVEVLSMEMVHGMSSAPTLWHKVKLAIAGDKIQLWVDGRPLRPVLDDSYPGPGFVGLVTNNSLGGGGDKSSFRDVRILGKPQEAPKWNTSRQRIKPYFIVTTAASSGCGNICRAPNGDLLVTLGNKILRSKDNGRAWAETGTLPAGVPDALLYATKDRALGLLTVNMGQPPFRLRKAVSKDSGQTWADSVQVAMVSFPKERAITGFYPSCLLRLKDGALLIFAYAEPNVETLKVEGRLYSKPGALGRMGMCFRSEDDGQSWSGPINIDGPPYDNGSFLLAKEFSEISAAQAKDGKILALTRPYSSPLMWETWSEDGGKTWTPQARGPFPLYACYGSMTTTRSGAMIITGRFPGIAAQVSRDNGMTWKCYKIDNTLWANGAIYEVEPDVVLYIYGGGYGTQNAMRGQRIKITPEGLSPGPLVK